MLSNIAVFTLRCWHTAACNGGLANFAILAICLFIGGRRRALLFVLAIGLVLAATETACGNGSSESSTQIITSVAASSSAGTTVSGLPATLGTMTLNGANSGL